MEGGGGEGGGGGRAPIILHFLPCNPGPRILKCGDLFVNLP